MGKRSGEGKGEEKRETNGRKGNERRKKAGDVKGNEVK
jgi:hypothetical protein